MTLLQLAPKIFHAFFSMMKPLLNQATLGKIKIYSKEEESKWKTALLEEIDPSQLPAYYGGTMTDPDGDPKCPSKVFVVMLIIVKYSVRNFSL